MSFQPTLPLTGFAGWAFLKRTMPEQQAAFAKTPTIERQLSRFLEAMPRITSLDALLKDTTSLNVVLSSVGLQDDIRSTALIRQVVEGGTEAPNALANRLTDKRYLELAKMLAPLVQENTALSDEAIKDVSRSFKTTRFEEAIGAQDDNLRLAIYFERMIPEVATAGRSDEARWFSLLGNPPIKKVIQESLGLPKEFGALDVDDQVARLKQALRSRFGVAQVTDLGNADVAQGIVKRFLLTSQINAGLSLVSPAQTALMLLQNR